jgi:uncharacterized protein (DUF4415 family)
VWCSRAARTGKTRISIFLNNTVLDHFRAFVENAGGGNYQTLINDALVAYTLYPPTIATGCGTPSRS